MMKLRRKVDYGVYFTEDAAWDIWDLIVERDAETEFEDKYGFSMTSATWKSEVNKLMKALNVVTNNISGQIGGGGTPLQPLGSLLMSGLNISEMTFPFSNGVYLLQIENENGKFLERIVKY